MIFILLFSLASSAEDFLTIQQEDASFYIGKNVRICDVVSNVSLGHTGKVYFINLEHKKTIQYAMKWNRNPNLSVVLWQDDAEKMSVEPVRELSGRSMCMDGKLTTYMGMPQLKLQSYYYI